MALQAQAASLRMSSGGRGPYLDRVAHLIWLSLLVPVHKNAPVQRLDRRLEAEHWLLARHRGIKVCNGSLGDCLRWL